MRQNIVREMYVPVNSAREGMQVSSLLPISFKLDLSYERGDYSYMVWIRGVAHSPQESEQLGKVISDAQKILLSHGYHAELDPNIGIEDFVLYALRRAGRLLSRKSE